MGKPLAHLPRVLLPADVGFLLGISGGAWIGARRPAGLSAGFVRNLSLWRRGLERSAELVA